MNVFSHQFKFAIFFFSYLCCSRIIAEPGGQLIYGSTPVTELGNHCDIESRGEEIHMFYDIKTGDSWDFNRFRNWTRDSFSTFNQMTISLTVYCTVGSFIILPRSYRAFRLRSLKVQDCLIKGIFSDISNPNILEIPDILEVVEIINSRLHFEEREVVQILLAEMHKEYECAPLNLVRWIYRNITVENLSGNIADLSASSSRPSDFLTNYTRSTNLNYNCHMKNLRVLELSGGNHNSFFGIKNALSNLYCPQLRVLNLTARNEDEYPPIVKSWRENFGRLEVLDLSHNNITRFENFRQVSLSTDPVGYIDLKYNNIRALTDGEIRSITNIRKAVIDVRHNPFICDCNMVTFSGFLKKHMSAVEAGLNKNYSYLWNLQCVKPERFFGLKIKDLSEDELCSKEQDAFYFKLQIICLAVVVVLLLLVIFLFARYRQEIRILAYTRLNIILLCQTDVVEESKKYDAFVSYSHLDSDWVINTLLPRLENPSSGPLFRLCLHQRDFLAGAAIADNIVQSIESSRHTILVLSNNFLQSEWCLMEFRTAFHQSLLKKKKHLIIVLLDDVPIKELDADLRKCLKLFTYVEVDDCLFWDKIVYSLTDKTKKRNSHISKNFPPGKECSIDVDEQQAVSLMVQ